MKVIVDVKKCQLHGQCIISAPKVFSFDADGNINWVPAPDEAERPEIEDAADVCPVQAITIED
jgi:ferredoxin